MRVFRSLCSVVMLTLMLFVSMMTDASAQVPLTVTSTNGASAYTVRLYIDNVFWTIVDLVPRQTKQFNLPADLTVGNHNLKIQLVSSESVTGLAGYMFELPKPSKFLPDGSQSVVGLLNKINNREDDYNFYYQPPVPHIELDLPGTREPSVRPRFQAGGSLYNLIGRIKIEPIRCKATVLDEENNPLSNVKVKISISGDNGPAGHVVSKHLGDSIHGWLAKPGETPVDDNKVAIDANTPVLQSDIGGSRQDSGSGWREELVLTSDLDGEVAFDYIAPEVSGVDTITAEVFDHPEIAPETGDIKIQLVGLVQFGPSLNGSYILVGSTSSHPVNHFCTPDTEFAIQNAANLYVNKQKNDPVLKRAIAQLKRLGYDFPAKLDANTNKPIVPYIPESFAPMALNDMSLVWGGLFDVEGTFSSPHGGHRWGNNIDIGTRFLITGGQPSNPTTILAASDSRYPSNSNVNTLVRAVNYRRAQLQVEALKEAGWKILDEGDHIHVSP